MRERYSVAAVTIKDLPLGKGINWLSVIPYALPNKRQNAKMEVENAEDAVHLIYTEWKTTLSFVCVCVCVYLHLALLSKRNVIVCLYML